MIQPEFLLQLHVGLLSASLAFSLGEISAEPQDNLLTRHVLKRVVLSGHWPKGKVDTLKEVRATERYDPEDERQRLLELKESFASRDLTTQWPRHPLFGPVSGREMSHLHARHIDYHLRQFGG